MVSLENGFASRTTFPNRWKNKTITLSFIDFHFSRDVGISPLKIELYISIVVAWFTYRRRGENVVQCCRLEIHEQ